MVLKSQWTYIARKRHIYGSEKKFSIMAWKSELLLGFSKSISTKLVGIKNDAKSTLNWCKLKRRKMLKMQAVPL